MLCTLLILLCTLNKHHVCPITLIINIWCHITGKSRLVQMSKMRSNNTNILGIFILLSLFASVVSYSVNPTFQVRNHVFASSKLHISAVRYSDWSHIGHVHTPKRITRSGEISKSNLSLLSNFGLGWEPFQLWMTVLSDSPTRTGGKWNTIIRIPGRNFAQAKKKAG